MKLLLDTHAVVWALLNDKKLSSNARAAIANSDVDVHVSVASVWEIAIKVGLGKWPQAQLLVSEFEGLAEAAGYRVLHVLIPHVRLAGIMPSPHRDPFDRLLAAQSQIEGLTLLTADANVQALVPAWLW